jgi:hypothetical protein
VYPVSAQVDRTPQAGTVQALRLQAEPACLRDVDADETDDALDINISRVVSPALPAAEQVGRKSPFV